MKKQETMSYDKEKIAEYFANKTCGNLHIAWLLDAYWGQMTKQFILPAAIAIHKNLVRNKYTKASPARIHNDTLFFVKPNKKFLPPEGVDLQLNTNVFVWNTPNKNFLFIMNGKDNNINLHIRQVWNSYKKSDEVYLKYITKDVDEAIANAENLAMFSADKSKYSIRPNLETYKTNNFQIPFVPKDHLNYKCHYGDFRDSGYVLSFESWRTNVEGSKLCFPTIEFIATCLIPFGIRELKIKKIKLPNGYNLNE